LRPRALAEGVAVRADPAIEVRQTQRRFGRDVDDGVARRRTATELRDEGRDVVDGGPRLFEVELGQHAALQARAEHSPEDVVRVDPARRTRTDDAAEAEYADRKTARVRFGEQPFVDPLALRVAVLQSAMGREEALVDVGGGVAAGTHGDRRDRVDRRGAVR